jgi:hypothetical protein
METDLVVREGVGVRSAAGVHAAVGGECPESKEGEMLDRESA